MKLRPLYPALLLAAGVLLASFLAVQHSSLLVLAAPLSLAASVLAADALNSRLRYGRARLSPAALILASAFLLASLLVGTQDLALLKQLIPLLGASAAVSLPLRPRKPKPACHG